MVHLQQHYNTNENHAMAQIIGPGQLLGDVLAQLQWFTTVLRPSKSGVTVSRGAYDMEKSSEISLPGDYCVTASVEIFLLDNDGDDPKLDPEKEVQGWTALVPGSILDYDSMPYDKELGVLRPPHGFVGLEAPFNIKELAEATIEVKGRQALSGGGYVLVPTKVREGAIQWRCFSGEDPVEEAEEFVNDGGDNTFSNLNWKELSKYRNFVS